MTSLKPTFHDIVHADPSELIAALTERLPFLYTEAARRREYADLAGEGEPVKDLQHSVSRLIGRLKRAHADLGELDRHFHVWGSDDYCVYCGADGQA